MAEPPAATPQDAVAPNVALQAAETDEAASHVLRLYVAGTTARSARAIATARRLLETRLPGRYTLAVVDIYQDPEAAKTHQIVAVPTLIRDLSDQARVLAALGLEP